MLKRKSYYALIDQCLSRELRGDVRYLISNNLFAHVWWLAKCEREFLEDLSVFIQREAFAAKERIPSGPDILNILMQVTGLDHSSRTTAHLSKPRSPLPSSSLSLLCRASRHEVVRLSL